jgi:hypothetical protein
MEAAVRGRERRKVRTFMEKSLCPRNRKQKSVA